MVSAYQSQLKCRCHSSYYRGWRGFTLSLRTTTDVGCTSHHETMAGVESASHHESTDVGRSFRHKVIIYAGPVSREERLASVIMAQTQETFFSLSQGHPNLLYDADMSVEGPFIWLDVTQRQLRYALIRVIKRGIGFLYTLPKICWHLNRTVQSLSNSLSAEEVSELELRAWGDDVEDVQRLHAAYSV